VKVATTKSPKDGAQRKRDHDRRKREQGLKEFRAWVTEDEARQLGECLRTIRADLLEDDNV
jgi:hypothetical protein